MCRSAIEINRPLRAEDTLTIGIDYTASAIQQLESHAVALTDRVLEVEAKLSQLTH
jgi:hypothetical protein